MRMKYFGDSYDIVKRSLMGWLAPREDWAVHPMFSEDVCKDKVKAFERFLGASVLTKEPLTLNTNRAEYFANVACEAWHGHILFDPDTGVRMRSTKGKKAPYYIFGGELREQVRRRPDHLTLVFDQSVRRGSEHCDITKKLEQFTNDGLLGIGYVSQALFLILTCNKNLIAKARARLLEAGLPESRVISSGW